MQTSVIDLDQDWLSSCPVTKKNRQHQKGGVLFCAKNFPAKKKRIPDKEEMKTSNDGPAPDSQNVNPLIRTADWVRARGQLRPISEDPAVEEQIGILFNMIRRRKNISLERLAMDTGYRMEELIAFEAGLLSDLRICEMVPVLAEMVGVQKADWLQEIQTGTSNLQPQ